MFEEQVNRKQYYKSLIDTNDNRHPLEVLGEAYILEQKEERADLSYIRFAQGELYFMYKDFEAAIFKWENITNEFNVWARKNMADAYFELELYSPAENIYTTIVSDSLILNTEVAIKLFYLYQKQDRDDLAAEMIKQAVALNPDYEDITELARTFFEKHKDWNNAFELAVNETIRTNNQQWVNTLIEYIENKHMIAVSPDYFSEILQTVLTIDNRLFARFSSALWNSYKEKETYFTWLTEYNGLFANSQITKSDAWKNLSLHYQETYLFLLSGKFLLSEVHDIVPDLLTNWLKIVDGDEAAFAASAILAWNEIFSGKISSAVVDHAENLLHHSKKNNHMVKNGLNLFDAMVHFAEIQEIQVSPRMKWIVGKLENLETHNVLVAGDLGKGHPELLKKLVGEADLEPTATTTIFTHNDSRETVELTYSEMLNSPLNDDAENEIAVAGKWVEMKHPNRFLEEFNLSLIDSSELNEDQDDVLNLADSLLFLVNENDPFLEKDRDLFLKIQKKNPDLPFHFLLYTSSNQSSEGKNKLGTIISNYFPVAKLFTFSEANKGWDQLNDLGEFITGNIIRGKYNEARAKKILYFVRKTITALLEKRVEKETNLVESINWNKKMVGKLNGAINQLNDLKAEKLAKVKNSYEEVKEVIQEEILDTIPKLLKESVTLVTEDSDFRKIHLELNEHMNRTIKEYVHSTILPKFHSALEAWIKESAEEFQKSQTFLDELSAGFNDMFEENRMELNCDFRVLEDWKRDATRLTSNIYLENSNIFLRNTPSQFLLKSAGKLLGSIGQNKTSLAKRYKHFIETEDYQNIAESIVSKLMAQFELFEKGLDRDMVMFFQNPDDVLDEFIKEAKEDNLHKQDILKEMDDHPESYNDPLTVFDLRLIQYEWMIIAGSAYQYN